MFARDIMVTRFPTLEPSQSVAEAIGIFRTTNVSEGKRIFGLMVVDEKANLVGMLSMYDVLLFVQPKHVQLWGEMDELESEIMFDELLERVKSIQVSDIMTTEIVTVGPRTHVLIVSDLMLKHHIRRIPVVDNGQVVGIVYLSDLFNHLLKKFS